jgi:uncharacterized membrane protein YhiD involved in acid resistance
MNAPTGEVLRLLVAILAGFLIGLDRERAEVRKQHQLFAGIRTFSLIALAGAVPALMLDRWGAIPSPASPSSPTCAAAPPARSARPPRSPRW